jgi:AraC-like DNA-binding protein
VALQENRGFVDDLLYVLLVVVEVVVRCTVDGKEAARTGEPVVHGLVVAGKSRDVGRADSEHARARAHGDEPVFDGVADAYRRLHRRLERPVPTLEKEAALTAFVSTLVRQGSADVVPDLTSGDPRTGLRTAREYLGDQVDRNVTLAELSAVTGLPPFVLARAFKRYYGCHRMRRTCGCGLTRRSRCCSPAARPPRSRPRRASSIRPLHAQDSTPPHRARRAPPDQPPVTNLMAGYI